ncbi:hypothetical protein Echvi_1034 [Echinicola vietnamensis DSM 17526]|uniref:Uncharacterized protein n=1 Tax=Echinicola vietnamensis (strain DSM 17526 / LMG 23754 / KMM 6221) TaxID=926556 RepID=L0FXB9_ECHVK|nr:hypothetical protein Echvi_1034 [Echinicola vietnamensis DSM 17526]
MHVFLNSLLPVVSIWPRIIADRMFKVLQIRVYPFIRELK